MTHELARAWIHIACVFALFVGSTFALSWWRQRVEADAEVARKMLHAGLGLTALTFPLLFDATWPLALLAIAATSHLWAMRRVEWMRQKCGRVLAARPGSAGEFCYIAAVLLIWIGARGNLLLYVAPLLALALADAAGALVGLRCGRRFYNWGGGRKTREGSLAVFCLALACVLASLLFLDARPLWQSLALSFVAASLVCLVEAVTPLGADNLAIPLAAFAILAASENGFVVVAIVATFACTLIIFAARRLSHRAQGVSQKDVSHKLLAARW